MKKILKTIAISGVLVIELMFFGCAIVPKLVTPAWIEKEAAEYADVNVPSTNIFGVPVPYTNLYDAELVERKMNFKHLTNQLAGARLMEDDQMAYDYVAQLHSLRVQEAQALQETLFNPTGPIGLMIAGLGFGSLGMLGGGRFLKSPREKELENIVNGNNNDS